MKRLLLVLLVGCQAKAPPPKAVTELRVPLPEGWVASGSNDRLLAGPRGRSLVSFESKPMALPGIDALVSAVEAQKATSIERIEGPRFVAARYTLEAHDAFVGVKSVGARTVWCASLPAATDAELSTSLGVCRDIELRPGD